MTIRKLWLLVLILMAVIAVSINAFILSALTDRYFTDYRAEDYQNHFDEILDYSTSALQAKELSINQMAMELETHLDDPITGIKLYDAQGKLIVDVHREDNTMGRSMMGRMMNYDESDSETDATDVTSKGSLIGQLNITRYSSLENSIVAHRFKSSLFINSLYSIAVVLVIALFIGIFISRKMSKDLTSTVKMAHDIAMGNEPSVLNTNISEIRTIQQSLESLKNRLKLKAKSRKVLIDELIHQTRTPLTVIKTHLEGFSDNIIEMTPEEISVCENQIDNITAIISNMSNLIDAEKDFDGINIEKFEISSLLKQITNGLKAQFEKKNIAFAFASDSKVTLNTDKYKLSQAVYNILTNAYKYTDEGGKVNLSYTQNNSSLSIQVKDNGVGIKQTDIEKIFDAYFRSNTTIGSQGEGLGLYIAKENIERLQGIIEVSSSPGNGSVFTITIPIGISDIIQSQ